MLNITASDSATFLGIKNLRVALKNKKAVKVTKDNLEKFLGIPKYTNFAAEENGIGRCVLDHSKKFYVTANEYRDTTEYEVEMIYLNALGYLYPDCDYSYATQRSIPTKHCKEVSIIDFITNEEYADINW